MPGRRGSRTLDFGAADYLRPTSRAWKTPASPCSKVEDEVAGRPCAADEHAARAGSFDGVGAVVDGARDDGCFAAMADAGAARPAHRYVAGFCQFQQAWIGGVPGDREVAAREGDEGTGARFPSRRVGRLQWCGRDAGSLSGSGTEDLRVDA